MKPDRFTRIARKSIIRLGHEDEDIATLLRREHAWMRQMVNQLWKREEIEPSQIVGYWVGLRKVLHKLEQCRK